MTRSKGNPTDDPQGFFPVRDGHEDDWKTMPIPSVAQTIPIAVQIPQVQKSDQNPGKRGDKITTAVELVRPLKREHATVFNAKGKRIWDKDGGHDFVPLKELEHRDLEGATFIHNHPSGVAPSVDDIGSACAMRLGCLKAVGKTGYTYTVEPPEGHDTFEPEMWDDINRAGRAADDSTREEFSKLLQSGEMSEDEANIDHWHNVNEAIAAATGIRYTREGQGHYDLGDIKATHHSHIPVYQGKDVHPKYPSSKSLANEADTTFTTLNDRQEDTHGN